MARNAIESDFRSSKMATAGHFVKKIFPTFRHFFHLFQLFPTFSTFLNLYDPHWYNTHSNYSSHTAYKIYHYTIRHIHTNICLHYFFKTFNAKLLTPLIQALDPTLDYNSSPLCGGQIQLIFMNTFSPLNHNPGMAFNLIYKHKSGTFNHLAR